MRRLSSDRRLRFSMLTGFAMALAMSGLSLSEAFADRIMLKGGGQLKGKMAPDPQDPKKVLIFMDRGKTPLHQEKARISEVIDEPSVLDQYLPKREKAPRTAEGQFDLGFWCEQVKLKDFAQFHYEEALRLDPQFALAHEKLGHVSRGGRWLVGDEIKKAQGLVKVKGRWVTATQKGQIEKDDAVTKEQTDWVRNFKSLQSLIANGTDDQRRDAESKLMANRDPASVKALVRVFNADSETSRNLLAHALGNIDGAEAAIALVNGLVNEEDSDLRHTFVAELKRRKEPEIEKQLVKALKSNMPEYINRAAWGIANLNLTATTPNLVSALTATKLETVMSVPPGGGLNGMVGNGGPIQSGPTLSPAPIAYNGSSIAYLYPPQVGPGVVAFGAGSVPSYGLPPIVSDPLAMVLGDNPDGLANVNPGAGANPNRGPIPQTIAIPVENEEVLSALVKFTGRDFGYDKDAWRGWIKTSFKVNAPAVRRVAQP